MRRHAQLSVLLLVSTLPVMTGAVLSPALPALQEAFGGGERIQVWARWALTTPALFTAVGAPLAGILTDRVGRRPVLLASLILFGGSGGVGGLLHSLPAITVSRAVLGLAAGGIATAVTTLIVDYYDDRQSTVMGRQAAVMAISAMAYTVLGGMLTDLSWRAPFGVYVLALGVAVPAFQYLPEPRGAVRSEEVSDPAETDVSMPWGRIGILYGLAFLGLGVFNLIRVELPYYLQSLGVHSGLWIGGLLSVGTVSGALTSLAYDRVQAWAGTRGTLALLFGLFTAGFGLIAVVSSPLGVVGGLLLAGGGMGLLVPALNDGVGEATPSSVRGRILGGLSTLRNLGRFASPLLTDPILVGVGAAAPFLGGAVLAGMLSLGLLLWAGSCAIPRGHSPEPHSALPRHSGSTAPCSPRSF